MTSIAPTEAPTDTPALAALGRLARDGGARVQRGALTLAGSARPAWLAIGGDGLLLAAVLIGDGVMVGRKRASACETRIGKGRW